MTVSEVLSGVLVLTPDRYFDQRGFFSESWNRRRYVELGIDVDFVQDNLSFSQKGVIRGLHFQNPSPQAKLVSVLVGSVFDVVVDVRTSSPTYGCWISVELSAENGKQVFIPAGFAHGFQATSETALFSYKCSDYYRPDAEKAIRWNDPDLAIPWPIGPALVSSKDEAAPFLKNVPARQLF